MTVRPANYQTVRLYDRFRVLDWGEIPGIATSLAVTLIGGEILSADTHLLALAGATPQDGPATGAGMVIAVASLFSAKPVRGDVGMSTVILPRRNEKDLEDLPRRNQHGAVL